LHPERPVETQLFLEQRDVCVRRALGHEQQDRIADHVQQHERDQRDAQADKHRPDEPVHDERPHRALRRQRAYFLHVAA
jgi:hypothetical protein